MMRAIKGKDGVNVGREGSPGGSARRINWLSDKEIDYHVVTSTFLALRKIKLNRLSDKEIDYQVVVSTFF